jgi:hypothetical protein
VILNDTAIEAADAVGMSETAVGFDLLHGFVDALRSQRTLLVKAHVNVYPIGGPRSHTLIFLRAK